jgi:hypothetical protein
MKRRSRAGKPVKALPRKALKLKPRKASKAVTRRGSAPASQETEVARLTRERDAALEQQTATSDVLRIISSSPSNLDPVFNAILANATRLCEAKFATLYLCDDDAFRVVAMHNTPLGRWPYVNIQTARHRAMAFQALRFDRVDPKEAQQWNEKLQKTVRDVADEWIAIQKQSRRVTTLIYCSRSTVLRSCPYRYTR